MSENASKKFEILRFKNKINLNITQIKQNSNFFVRDVLCCVQKKYSDDDSNLIFNHLKIIETNLSKMQHWQILKSFVFHKG